MASKGKAPAKAPSTRVCGSTSQQQPPLEIQLYETPAHEERAKILEERRSLHERTIKFPKGEDTFEERILARRWEFMYELSIPTNLSWVREFYANRAKKDQREIFLRGKKVSCSVSTIEKILNIPKFKGKCGYSEISVAYNKNALNMDDVLKVIGKEGATWWVDPRNPVIPARPKKKILNYEAWMWLKLILCNFNPTRHETTLSMEIVLLIYALMMDISACLASVMSYAMNIDPTKTKTHLLIYPMFITKWARENNVPTFLGDVILKIPKSQQLFPYGKWREDDEEVASPIPPPAAPADIPTPSAPSSPEPSRRHLMRALRRNERIIRRHEQLMLMLHLGLDTSGLEQISSPEISQNQQDQRAGSAQKGNAEEDEDFQSTKATGDASTYTGQESAVEE
ncbi:hypothetical protein PIB30_102727 [Stylosanthes scabra]|uniref:Putative plant transposon protein domain-containing protein n=1 Tax=Stylosanthes scabra TaxID=79078 RepID=A0ABU6ZWD0_9FABA|nr:hypothetical protein [Stylosanthes scabra]